MDKSKRKTKLTDFEDFTDLLDSVRTRKDLLEAIKEILNYRDFLLAKIPEPAWWEADFLKTSFKSYPRGINWNKPTLATTKSETCGDIVCVEVHRKAWGLKVENRKLENPPKIEKESDCICNLLRFAAWCSDEPKDPEEISEKPKNRPREKHIKEAYENALDDDASAEDIADWINKNLPKDTKTGREYYKISADGVRKSKIWKKKQEVKL